MSTTSGQILYLLFPVILGSNVLIETSREYSDYQSKTFFKERRFDTTPENFAKHLSIFSECIIHIINFDGVDIKRDHDQSSYIPLVLTRLDRVYLYFNNSYTFSWYFLPFETFRNLKTRHDRQMTRHDWDMIKGRGYSFAKLETVLQKRQEACVANIYLHPPKRKNKLHWKTIHDELSFPRLTYLSIEFWNKLSNDLVGEERSYRKSQINSRWHYEILLSNTKSTDYATTGWVRGLLFYFHR